MNGLLFVCLRAFWKNDESSGLDKEVDNDRVIRDQFEREEEEELVRRMSRERERRGKNQSLHAPWRRKKKMTRRGKRRQNSLIPFRESFARIVYRRQTCDNDPCLLSFRFARMNCTHRFDLLSIEFRE